MHFILLTDSFYPLANSGSIIVGDLTDELLLQGHNITVLTFDPTQKVEYDIKFKDRLKLIRIKAQSRKYGKVGRLWAEMNYSRKIIKTIKNLEEIQCDGVISYSPSIFWGSAVNWLKKNYNCSSYLIIRDIFPKWALAAGLLNDGLLYRYLKFIERNLYRSSNIIGIEAKSDLKYFKSYGLDKSIKIEVLNNWGATLINTDYHFPNNILDSNKVNIVYGGNMGDAQDLLSLLKMIDFSILGESAHLYLIGSGNQFDKIKNLILQKKLLNVTLLPPLDRQKYLAIMAKADIGLVSLGNKMTSNNYPLKMIGYMQLSKPILASVNKNNEIIPLIHEKNIGFASQANDIVSFNNNLFTILSNSVLRKEQGKNALKLFNDQFTVEVATCQIIENF